MPVVAIAAAVAVHRRRRCRCTSPSPLSLYIAAATTRASKAKACNTNPPQFHIATALTMNENSFANARSLLALLLVVAAFVMAVEHHRTRHRSIIRDRAAAMDRFLSYSAKDFKRRFRMHRWQFNFICNSIRHNIEPDDAGKLQAIRSAGSYVPAELRLAATLRILAGGSYLDASDLFAIAASSIWASTVWPTCEAICNCPELDNIHFPFDDETKLREHEATFRKTAGRHWPGPGTVAAGDGCAFGVRRQLDDHRRTARRPFFCIP